MDTANDTTSPGENDGEKIQGYLVNHWRTDLKDVRHGPYEIWSMEQETGKPHSNPHRGINL